MTPGSPKPEAEDGAADGASEAEAERYVHFEPDRSAGPGADKDPKREPPDAAELAGTKRRDGEREPRDKSAPGAIATEDLTTETDDGVS